MLGTTFNLLTFGLLIASIFSITSKNPVISVIFLITTFVIAAGYLILLGIKFIGISYIVIYVGAIAVLFLFVIMMINIKLTDILETGSNYTKNLPLAIVIITLFLSIITAIISPLYSVNPLFVTLFNFNSELFDLLISQYNSVSNNGGYSVEIGGSLDLSSVLNYNIGLSKITNNSDIYFSNFEQIEILGHNLYTFGAILLIILSIILLLAMLATIVISKKNVNI